MEKSRQELLDDLEMLGYVDLADGIQVISKEGQDLGISDDGKDITGVPDRVLNACFDMHLN